MWKKGKENGSHLADWGRSADVLIRLLVDERLQVSVAHACFVQKYCVVHRPSSSFDGGVSAEIEIVFERMGNTSLDKSTRKRVAVAIAFLREEADVVALAADHDHKRDVDAWVGSLEQSLHVVNFLL